MNKIAAIQSFQLQQLLAASKTSILASILLASVLSLMQSGFVSMATNLAWLFGLILISLPRLYLVYVYQREAAIDPSGNRARLIKFRLGIVLAGVAWGSAAVLMFPANDTLHQVLLIIMLAGMTAGGVVSFSADFISAIGYSLAILLPLLVRLFSAGDTLSVEIGLVGVLFLGFMLASLRHINRNATENIVLRLDAVDREEAVRASEERYRLLLSNSPVGIFHYDINLTISYCNQRFAEILSSPVERVVGLNMTILKDQSVLPALRKSLAGERSYYEGHYQATLSDALGWIVLISAPSRDHFGNIVGGIGIVQDSTARKQTEDALQQQLLFSDALNKISKTVIEKEDRDLILAEVAGVIGETLRIDRAIIYEVSFASNRATGLCEWLNPVHPEMQSARTTISLGQFIGTANHIWKTRNGITSQKDKVNTHFQEDGCSKMLHQDWNIQSLIWHPMAFYQEGFYLLTLSQVYSHREWTKEEIDFLDSVSKLIQIALEKIRLLAEHKKTESDMRVAAFAFESQEGMLITDENNLILRVNQSFTHITGYTVEEVLGKNPSLLASGRHDAHFFATLWESLNVNGTWEGEIWNRRKNGEIFPEHMIITAVRDTHNCLTNYVATFNDITDSKAAEEEIRNLAFYDPLTRLPNRRLLTDRMSHAFASSARSGRKGALLFLDLDNFKTLNDTLGHVMGDLLLQQVAQRLCSCVREGDTVVRLGGDEFVVMLEDLSELSFEAAAQTETIGEKILTTLNVPYQLAEREFRNTPSIGATLFNGHQNGVDDLFKQADIAMYQSKKAGRNTLRFFDPKMQDTINTRVALEGELNQALANHQFHLYFQIQVNSLNKPIGAETLIRWLHPIRGLVSPAQFIPLAEETGLILSIGEWVLETACAQLKAWQNCELTCNLALAVNVSAQQFRLPNFVVQVSSMVQHYAINPKLLKLELTESMLLEDIEDIISTMSALKEIGVRFSLDDFGTGYSSLQYLKRLPLNQLKIDQSFVRDLVIDKSDKAIVRTIIAMAHSLDLNVIAEGVETEEQRLSLIEMNCSLFQGYLFGKPVPIVEFESLLSNISKEYY